MTKPIEAVVAGHICLDIIPDLGSAGRSRPEDIFTPGRLVQVGAAALSSGGPVSNTGLALHRLGASTSLMGKTGADLFGGALRELVAAQDPGLADGMIVDESVDTSYTIIMSAPGLDRIFFHCPGANDTFSVADVRFGLLEQARLFHFGYPPVMRRMYEDSGRELAELFRRAKAAGITTSLDLTFPDPASDAGRADWRAILSAVLPHADIFLPSVGEILFMLRRAEHDRLLRSAGADGFLAALTPALIQDLGKELVGMGAKIVGLKLGERGFFLRTAGRKSLASFGRLVLSDAAVWADRELWAPCFRVRVAGTTGAGDATIAGFLAALLRGLGPEEAMTMAVAVGACCVEASDAVSGIRSWDETTRRVAAGWERHALRLDAPGWRPLTDGLWENTPA